MELRNQRIELTWDTNDHLTLELIFYPPLTSGNKGVGVKCLTPHGCEYDRFGVVTRDESKATHFIDRKKKQVIYCLPGIRYEILMASVRCQFKFENFVSDYEVPYTITIFDLDKIEVFTNKIKRLKSCNTIYYKFSVPPETIIPECTKIVTASGDYDLEVTREKAIIKDVVEKHSKLYNHFFFDEVNGFIILCSPDDRPYCPRRMKYDLRLAYKPDIIRIESVYTPIYFLKVDPIKVKQVIIEFEDEELLEKCFGKKEDEEYYNWCYDAYILEHLEYLDCTRKDCKLINKYCIPFEIG